MTEVWCAHTKLDERGGRGNSASLWNSQRISDLCEGLLASTRVRNINDRACGMHTAHVLYVVLLQF